MEIPDDFLSNILKVNSEELCREILEESIEPLTKSMQNELGSK